MILLSCDEIRHKKQDLWLHQIQHVTTYTDLEIKTSITKLVLQLLRLSKFVQLLKIHLDSNGDKYYCHIIIFKSVLTMHAIKRSADQDPLWVTFEISVLVKLETWDFSVQNIHAKLDQMWSFSCSTMILHFLFQIRLL